MLWLFAFCIFLANICVWIYFINNLKKENARLKESYQALGKYCKSISSRYAPVRDAQAEASKILQNAHIEADNIILKANNSFANAEAQARKIEQKILEEQEKLNNENQRINSLAEKIINEAQQRAVEIAGNALDAKENAKLYESTAKSMRNIILGYGTDYLIPSNTLIDDLADTYGYTQASKDYKEIRKKIREIVKNNLAATCDYSEQNRRHTAISFITDAFNGKVETIIAKAKSDNFGTLKQKLIDAFTIVNYNGTAFRNARINEDFFNMCMEELRLACVLNEIRKKDIEEQRQIREQIKEEEKVRREIEKTLRDAKKEEELLQIAMEKAKLQLEKANAEQRAIYEHKIAELEQKYHEAEERNKRALSMAQQTKSGHIYIISNEGSFGRNIYKIGMTRRLEPLDRIRELSNASVPFPFEVHAMIWSEDAPTLETMLHKKFALSQLNKVNFRKEFFRLSLSEIRTELEKNGLNVKWTIASESTEYLESLAIEKAIQNDEQAREAWLNHQFELTSSLNLNTKIQKNINHEYEEDLEDENN